MSNRYYIGGSDVAAACGMNKFQSRLQLYREKLGLVPAFAGNDATYWGTELEPFLRRHASKHLGIKFRQSHKQWHHPQHAWAVAHIDGISKNAGLECKLTSYRNKKRFAETGTTINTPEDGLPVHYYCQCQWYMLIVGKPIWHVCVGIAGENEIRLMAVPFNAEFANELLRKAGIFWQEHVLAEFEPEIEFLIDANEEFKNVLRDSVTIPHNMVDVITEFRKAKLASKANAERLSSLEAKIKTAMKDAAALVNESGDVLATWRESKRNSVDLPALRTAHPELIKKYTRASSSRVFKFLENDEGRD